MPEDKSQYAGRRGRIRNVVFRDIHFLSSPGDRLPSSLFIGYDDDHAIENMSFERVSLDGKQLSHWPEGTVYTRYARNIRFEN